MNKIKNVSLLFIVVFQIIFAALPVLLVISWIYAPDELVLFSGFVRLHAIPANYSGMHVFTPQGIPEKAILHTLTIHEKMLGCIISAIPMMVYLFIISSLIKL